MDEQAEDAEIGIAPVLHRITAPAASLILNVRDNLAIVSLIVLIAAFGLAAPAFFSWSNLGNILTQATPIGLVALGMTYVILCGHIDLSVGAVVALSGLTLGWADHAGWPLAGSVGLALCAGGACGLFSGLLTAYARVPAFVTTLGMMSLGRGLALMMTEGRSISGFSEPLLTIANGTLTFVPWPVVILGVSALAAHVLMVWTIWGRYFKAIGSNRRAAFLAGIQVARLTTGVFIISGVAAAIAGVVLTSRLNSAHPLAGSLYELDAIAAVIVGGARLSGGKAGVANTMTGTLILAVMKNGLSMLNVTAYGQQLVVGSVLIGAVASHSLATRHEP